jgi:hypothetical protein
MKKPNSNSRTLLIFTSILLIGNALSGQNIRECDLDLGSYLGLEQNAGKYTKPSFVSIFERDNKVGKADEEPDVLTKYGARFAKGSWEKSLFEEMPKGGFSKIVFCVEKIAIRKSALKAIAASQEGNVKILMEDPTGISFINTSIENFKSLESALDFYQPNIDQNHKDVIQRIYVDVLIAKQFVEEIEFYGKFLIATVPVVLKLELDDFKRSINDFNKDLDLLLKSPFNLLNDESYKELFAGLADTVKRTFNKRKYFKEDLKGIQKNTIAILDDTGEIARSVTKMLDTFLKGLKSQIREIDSEKIQENALEILANMASKQLNN